MLDVYILFEWVGEFLEEIFSLIKDRNASLDQVLPASEQWQGCATSACVTMLIQGHHPTVPAAELLPCYMAKRFLSMEKNLFSLSFLIRKHLGVPPIACHM